MSDPDTALREQAETFLKLSPGLLAEEAVQYLVLLMKTARANGYGDGLSVAHNIWMGRKP